MMFWKSLLVGMFIAGSLGLMGSFKSNKPRILVLHSGDELSPWVQSVDRGIRSSLEEQKRSVALDWHYLRLRQNQSQGSRSAVAIDAQRLIGDYDPDVLLAVDDESNQLVAKEYAGKTRPKVVFVSIDQSPENYDYQDKVNVSGIMEALPVGAVREAIQAMRGGRPAKIAVIGTDTETGRAEKRQVDSFEWAPHTIVASSLVKDAVAWKEFIEKDAVAADILLVLRYDGLQRGNGDRRYVNGSKIAEWVEKNAKPQPIGVHLDYVEDGGGLSFAPPPADYGRRAIRLALDWMNASADSPPPPMTSSLHFDVAIRAPRLKARGVQLPSVYVEAARAAGSYFEQ
jgi:hypothetical protein